MKHTKIFFVLVLIGTFFLWSIPETGAEPSKPKYRSNLSIYGRIDVSIRFDEGWKSNVEPVANDPFEETDLKAKWTSKTPPSNILLIDGLWNKYSFLAKPHFGILSDSQLSQDEVSASDAKRNALRFGSMRVPSNKLYYDPIGKGAFNLLDKDASNLELGYFIGFSLTNLQLMFGSEPSTTPIDFDKVADYTLDILDEYDYEVWDEDEGPFFSPKDVGNAVYAAIIAAGGSPDEAERQAKKASDGWSRTHSYMIIVPQWRFNDSGTQQDRKLKVSPAISGFAVDPDSFSGFRNPNAPWTLDAVHSELSREVRSYKKVLPNDPLYKESGGLGRGILKAFGFFAGTDDDSQASDQWGLHAVGFTPKGTGQSAWDVYDGMERNIVVAIIDSGLDLKHPDRPRYIWKNKGEIADNGVDDDGNGYVDDIHGWNFVSENNNITDDYGHGTFVTGIIAANTNNGKGIAGVNPGAQIMVLKASNGEGSARDLAIYRALRYAVDNGAWVINISLGNRGQSRLVQIGLNYAHAMGRIVVVAAGNEGKDIAEYTPQGSRRVISVGATNLDGSVRNKSNKGLSLAMVAPGQSIYSLTAKNSKYDGKIISFGGGNYHRWNGTSFSAPLVTGTASLLWARNPSLTNIQVEDILLSSAAEIGDPGWKPETGLGQLSAQSAMVQSPKTAFAPRITEVYVNQIRKRVESVDIYGIIRGPVQSYTLEVGRGEKPDKDEWQRVFGPSKQTVNLGHIARIPGTFFSKGSQWTIRLTAKSTKGEIRMQQFLVNKKG